MSICSERSVPRRRQRGEMLLEALVAVLITGLIAGGLAHVQARVMATQRATKVERLVVTQLRDRMQTHGTTLCSTDSVELALTDTLTRSASVSCGAVEQLNVGVAGVTASVTAPLRVDLGVTAADLELDGDSPGERAADLLVSSHQ
ncbi:hypothetical protein RZA67_04335 [Stenotrophomonas sp. C3(2023)]|uniref:type IV pilus modification PilV family protein n=1 Tax=Stenotrophomonas sp. C3(2023) TaxID=3080277 RepID=UPI00293CB1E9|nr:hypothetical protein [Stenotrophomonas sp. C3(2023)]MDV3467962.1 hypothetical protein [Stenotrophomonas sp. C3(2023)]